MANNSYTKNYADGSALTESQLDAALQSLKPDIAQTTQLTQGATAGHFLKCSSPGAAAVFAAVPDPKGPSTIRNYGLKATVATGAIVFTVTTGAGSTPSASDAVDISFSDSSTTSATQSDLQITGSKTITLNASASLGVTGTSTQRIYVYGCKNSSNVVLAVSTRGDYDIGASVTTTAISASADSPNPLYATAALTVIPRLLGWVSAAKNSGGSWQTPSAVGLSSTPAPGYGLGSTEINFSSTSASYVDITNAALSYTTNGRPIEVTFIPSSAANSSEVYLVRSVAGVVEADYKLVRDSTDVSTNRLVSQNIVALSVPASSLSYVDFPPAGTYTYKLQGKLNNGTTFGLFRCRIFIRQL